MPGDKNVIGCLLTLSCCITFWSVPAHTLTLRQAEQKALKEERESLESTLNSSRKMKTLIKKEIEADTAKFGNKRRSPIVSREEAKAIDPTSLIPSDPITIILSEKGFVRAGKGHDLDLESLQFKRDASQFLPLPSSTLSMSEVLLKKR